MDDDPSPEPPEDLPSALAETLRAHRNDPHALRETIIYAQELLNRLHEPASAIEPRGTEEIVRVTERGGYTEVVKRDHGGTAYLYHVRAEPRPSGDEHLHWTLIGRVEPEA